MESMHVVTGFVPRLFSLLLRRNYRAMERDVFEAMRQGVPVYFEGEAFVVSEYDYVSRRVLLRRQDGVFTGIAPAVRVNYLCK